jgi:hypothetical protein
MNVQAKAKPVRIRVMSGGEEHSSLDSLRNNLWVQDIYPLIKDKRFSRWLRQQNETALADDFDSMTNSENFAELTESVYRRILELLKGIKLKNYDEMCELCRSWYKTDKDRNNANALFEYLSKSKDGVKFLFKELRDCRKDKEWNDILNTINDKDADVLYWLGKLNIEGKCDFQTGLAQIQQSAELGYATAKEYLKLRCFIPLSSWPEDIKSTIKEDIKKYREGRINHCPKFTTQKNPINAEVQDFLADMMALRIIGGRTDEEIFKSRLDSVKRIIENEQTIYLHVQKLFVKGLIYYDCKKGDYVKRANEIFEELKNEYQYTLVKRLLANHSDMRQAKFFNDPFKKQIDHFVDELLFDKPD